MKLFVYYFVTSTPSKEVAFFKSVITYQATKSLALKSINSTPCELHTKLQYLPLFFEQKKFLS
jgi:hypothetical protein